VHAATVCKYREGLYVDIIAHLCCNDGGGGQEESSSSTSSSVGCDGDMRACQALGLTWFAGGVNGVT
jgi:hypothetical protein